MSLSTIGREAGENGHATQALASAGEDGFSSKLLSARERFLASVVEHALSAGRRTPRDFLRHFPPKDLMHALRDQPRLRAKLLVSTTGINEKIALKKTPASAAEDLEIALAEGVTDEGDIVSLLDPDARVTHLDPGALWAFVAEGEFWRAGADPSASSIARDHVAYLLLRARAEKLVTDREILDGIGVSTLTECLPKEELGRVLERALAEGRAGRVFKDERVFDVLSPALLAEHVPLAHLWERVIAPKLAFRNGTLRAVGASQPPLAPVQAAHARGSSLPPPTRDLRSAREIELNLDDGEDEAIVVGDLEGRRSESELGHAEG